MSRAAQASEQDAALGRPTDEPQSSSSTAHRLVDDWIYDVRAAQTGRRGAAPGQRLSVHGGPIRLAGYPPKPPAGVPSRSAAGRAPLRKGCPGPDVIGRHRRICQDFFRFAPSPPRKPHRPRREIVYDRRSRDWLLAAE